MQNHYSLDELARRISALVPDSIHGLRADLEPNVRELLQQALGKMNLVTREEFDLQVALLERTREKLEALEQRLADK